MIDLISRKIFEASAEHRLLISSFIAAVVFYFAAFFSSYVSNQVPSQLPTVVVHALLFVPTFALLGWFYRVILRRVEGLSAKYRKQRQVLRDAYTGVDRLMSNHAARLEDAKTSPGAFADYVADCLRRIQELVDCTYKVFETAYGSAAVSEKRTDFEVTLMTKSYQDGNITIPAAANRHNRHPVSMNQRKSNPRIYDATVTAEIYRMERPCTQVISDTTTDHYKELYPDQKRRIQSSVILPVLSFKNELLGTLVVHCDRSGFFKTEDQKYWEDLLEVFARRIAAELIQLEILMSVSPPGVLIESPEGSPY